MTTRVVEPGLGELGRASRALRRLGLAMLMAGLAGCAAKAPPLPTVTTPLYPNFVFPAVPTQYDGTPSAVSHQRAWLFLQSGDLDEARRGFDDTLRGQRDFYPSDVGLAYVELAERDFDAAFERFGRTVERLPTYVPALVGSGEAALASRREPEALASFEAALAVDPTLVAVQRRIGVLQFRGVQAYVGAAREAAAAGELDDARRNYERAMRASPESGFLHRELAVLERDTGDLIRARELAQEAIRLDPSDAQAFAVLGEIEESGGAYDAAVEAYERAVSLDPALRLEASLERVRARASYARLPAEYRAIAAAPSVSRGALAALAAVRLGSLLAEVATSRAELITDARDHWAAPWIMETANAGVMEVYPNHTFQPDRAVRRGDLGRVAGAVLDLIARRDPQLARQWTETRIQFQDLSSNHLSYPAASRAVAAGVLSSLEGNRFRLTQVVTGPEAVAAIEQLEALVAQADGRRP